MSRYVTPSEAAEILDVAYPSVFKILKRAKIERPIENAVLYRRAEVEKLAEVRAANPPKCGRKPSGLTPIKTKRPPGTQPPLSRLIAHETEIMTRYERGVPVADLARAFKVSRQWMNTFIRARLGEFNVNTFIRARLGEDDR